MSSQLWQHRDRLLIFRSAPPPSAFHFTSIPGSDHAPGLRFSAKEHIVSNRTTIVSNRVIRFIDPYGAPHCFTIARRVSDACAVDAIAQAERNKDELRRYVEKLAACGVLVGNAASATATSVRTACVQITDLFVHARLTRFDDDF